MQDLHILDDMYQFSMNWFRSLFGQTFSMEEPGSEEEDKEQNENSEESIGAQKRRRAPTRPANGDMTKKQRLIEMEKRAVVLKN